MKIKVSFFVLSTFLVALAGCVNNQGVKGEQVQPVVPADSVADLEGLPPDQFFERAYEFLLQRDPEALVELGLVDLLPNEISLTNVSPNFLAETNDLQTEILALLHQYDYDDLDESGQISYLVFDWYLQEAIEQNQRSAYRYLVIPFAIRSMPQLYVMFFTDSHPLNTVADAEAYAARLHLLDEKLDQLIEQLEDQVEAGIIPPRMLLEMGIENIDNSIGYSVNESPLLVGFHSRAMEIQDLDEDARLALEDDIYRTLRDEIFPAIDRLKDYLDKMIDDAPQDYSLDQYPGGEDYYAFLLRQFTTSELTAEEIHQLGLSELDRIKDEVRQSFNELGYSEDGDIPVLYQRMMQESGAVEGDDIAAMYEDILEEADQNLGEYFDLRPTQALEVVGGDQGAFYSPGSLDGQRPGKFYARTTGSEAIYKMKTVAYHEGIPGHHFQISIAQEADILLFRNLLIFDGYAEGWALYAEYLASELGWYDEDPYGNLGRLQYEALRACRMIVDTGIHTQGWTYDQSVDFILQNTGISRGFAEYEVLRYIAYPGQAPAYLVGKIEILRLRTMAQEALGEDFDISEFHNILLQNGSMPLTILEQVVLNWIDQ
ncbi:MAG: DUF885 domain-containing protein [Anaerolineales bacterium]|jgi:uncharacterized protein (DUF885 family)